LLYFTASGNWLAWLSKSQPYFSGKTDEFFRTLFPNFPHDLIIKGERIESQTLNGDKLFSLPIFIKTHGYLSSFFGLVVRKISALNEQITGFMRKESVGGSGLEHETIYIAKIISLAKKTNTPLVIVKPFYIFSYPNFSERMWNVFAVTLATQFNQLSAIRKRIAEAYSIYAAFKDFAYIYDPTEKILTTIHTESDFDDVDRIMANDYVHFTADGNANVGKIIGDHLLSLGLVKRVSDGEWIHPNEIINDDAFEIGNLRYKDIRLENQNYYIFFSCFSLVFLCIYFYYSLRRVYTLIVAIIIISLFGYVSQKESVENLVIPLRILFGIVFYFSIYKLIHLKISIKKGIYILSFLFFTSVLLFINLNALSLKLAKLHNSYYFIAILKENIAWSDYLQVFSKYFENGTVTLDVLAYKFQFPIPHDLFRLLRLKLIQFLFAPIIPAFLSSVFQFDSVEIFFLLASIPYVVLYLFYLKIINIVFISKLKFLLYPIGLFLIKQEIDFLFPIVFLIVTLTSLGIYSISYPVKKYPITRYLSALAFWPLYYLVIPETLLLLGLVCIYFLLMEFYRNSFRLWSSIQNTFLWICVLFIPKLFILMLPSSKVNLDFMIQYSLLPVTFHLHSVYSFLAALLLLIVIHVNIGKIKFFKRKILQMGKHAF
jgi:hypothetical protein